MSSKLLPLLVAELFEIACLGSGRLWERGQPSLRPGRRVLEAAGLAQDLSENVRL